MLNNVSEVLTDGDPHARELVRDTGVVRVLGPAAANGRERTLHGSNDVGDRDLPWLPGKPKAAIAPALAADHSRHAELREDVLQEVERNALGGRAHTPNDILNAAGIFLFGFTYLYVGIVTLAGFKADGIGWYSLWVAALAAGFGLTTILRFHDTPTGLLWLQWSVLWGLFFVVLALGVERLTPVAGWLTLILSLTTCTIPGFLLLLGDWGKIPTWAVVASIIATAIAVILVAIRTVPLQTQTGGAPTDLRAAVSN